MLLPVGIAHPYQRLPVATWSLIGLNVVMAMATVATGFEGMRPLVLDADAFAPYQLLTYLFLHAGIFHLAGNMLFLWVYGRYVEDRLDPWRYLALYFTTGFAGDLIYIALGQGAPCVGASGAISGLMGFVIVIAPWNDVHVWWFIHWAQFGARGFDGGTKIAALWLVGVWLVFQLLAASGDQSGVAVMAHLGGFFAGAGLAALFRSETCKGTPWYVEPAPPGGGSAARRRLKAARVRGPTRRVAAVGHAVVLEALSAEASGVSVVKLLMKRLAFTPEEAKERVDALRAGEAQRFELESAEASTRLHAEALALGATGRVEGPPVSDSAGAPAAVGKTESPARNLDLPPIDF